MNESDNSFVCYIGRGKTGHAKTGKPRFIFWDTTGTGADHDRLDRILSKSWEASKGVLTNLPLKAFRAKMRKKIADMAPKNLNVDILDVALPSGVMLEFRIKQYSDLLKAFNYSPCSL